MQDVHTLPELNFVPYTCEIIRKHTFHVASLPIKACVRAACAKHYDVTQKCFKNVIKLLFTQHANVHTYKIAHDTSASACAKRCPIISRTKAWAWARALRAGSLHQCFHGWPSASISSKRPPTIQAIFNSGGSPSGSKGKLRMDLCLFCQP